jgi:hypothetical protein
MAVQIEASYGLGTQGPLYFGGGDEVTLLRVPEIRSAVRRALEQAQIEARRILETHRTSLDQLAAALLRNNFLDRDEVRDAVDPALYANVEGKPALTIGVAGPPPGTLSGGLDQSMARLCRKPPECQQGLRESTLKGKTC